MLEEEGIGGAGAAGAAKGATKAEATTSGATKAEATTDAEPTKATTAGAANGSGANGAGGAVAGGATGAGGGGAATLALTMKARLYLLRYTCKPPSLPVILTVLYSPWRSLQALLRAIKDEQGKSRGTRDALQRSML